MRGIYVITNDVNKKIYIGKSNNLRKRRNEHFNKLRKNQHENSKLQRAFNKYGEKNFIYEVLIDDDSLSDKELNEIEIMYTRLFGGVENGYNLTYGGGGSLGWRASVVQRLERSMNSRGEKNPFYGKKISPEHRVKMTEGARIVQKTPEYRAKISKAMKGRKFSEEHSKNKSLAQIGGKNPTARRCCVDGIEFECVKDVAIYYNMPHRTANYRINSTSEKFKDWYYL